MLVIPLPILAQAASRSFTHARAIASALARSGQVTSTSMNCISNVSGRRWNSNDAPIIAPAYHGATASGCTAPLGRLRHFITCIGCEALDVRRRIALGRICQPFIFGVGLLVVRY